jgi:hypothetical protein
MAIHAAAADLVGSGRVGVWLPQWLPANDIGAFDKLTFLQSLVRHMRCDVHATWRKTVKEDGTPGTAYKTHDEPLTDALLCRHLAGEIALGLYPMHPGNDTTTFAAFDIDDHKAAVSWNRMAAVAERIAAAAKQRGLYCVAVRSGGGHGIHLLIRWDTAQVARDVRALMATILEEEGLAEGNNTFAGAAVIGIEIFPKQDDLPPDGYGNLLALPFGRRSVPLDSAMQPIDTPMMLWPSSVSVPPEEKDEPELRATAEQFPADMMLAREALTYLDAERRDQWIDVGHALKHSFGDDGYPLWIEWSKTCPDKFKDVETPEEIWRGFKPRGKKPITVGTIYYRAMKAGWAGPHNYKEQHGGFYLVKRTSDGPKSQKLSNFTVHIVEDITLDEGSDYLRRMYVLESAHGRAPVDADKFSGLGWVDEVMGAKAVVTPGATLRGHLAAAIKHLSRPTKRTIYAHFGWRRIGDKWFYLHSDGSIGADGPVEGIEVQPGNTSLAAYSLPPVHDVKAAIKASLALVELAPSIMWPLLGGVYRAPLGQWCPVTTSLLLTGPTGERKTSVAMLAQAHYGIFERPPADWTSTANALERMTFVVKDGLVLIDDYVPKALRGDVQALLAKAERIFRGAANRKGRDRLNQRLTFQPEYYCRGMVLATGEDVPMGESLRARIVIVEVGKGSIPIGDKLDKAQANARRGLYAQAMAGYVQWLAGQDQLRARLADRQAELRRETNGTHARTPENIASLMLGVETLLAYAVAMQAITPQQSEEYRKQAWDALCEQARTQNTYLQDATPTRRFITLIRAVISSGRGHIDNVDGGEPRYDSYALGWRYRRIGEDGVMEPIGKLIGWIKADNLYLDPVSAYAEAQLLANAENLTIPVSAKTLWGLLDKAGHLVSKDPGLSSIREYVGGTRKRVLHLNAVSFLGLGAKETSADADSDDTAGPGAEDSAGKADGEDAAGLAARGDTGAS